MNNKLLSREFCRAYCHFYKPSKIEDPSCMGFIVAERLFEKFSPESLLLSEPPHDRSEPELPSEETVRMLAEQICAACSFAEHDCDFIENWRQGASAGSQCIIPCGGFLFLGWLLDKRIIDIRNISGNPGSPDVI